MTEFGANRLSDLERMERDRAIEWAAAHRSHVPSVVTFFNDAIDADKIVRNPFRSLSTRGPGRRDLDPMEPSDVEALAVAALEAYGAGYGTRMAAFVRFMAYTAMRTGEMLGVEWADIDFEEMRVRVWRQHTKGEVKLPKGKRRRTIVLLPEARDALMTLTDRHGPIFTGKRGGRMTQPALSNNWPKIEAKFGRDVDPYELRHFGGHHFYVRMDLASRVVAAQMGNSPRKVEDLYGHFKHGALEEIDRAVHGAQVVPIRKVG